MIIKKGTSTNIVTNHSVVKLFYLPIDIIYQSIKCKHLVIFINLEY